MMPQWKVLLTRASLLFVIALGFDSQIFAAEPAMFEAVSAIPSLNSLPAPEAAEKRSRLVRLAPAVPQSRTDGRRVAPEMNVNLFPDRELKLTVDEQRRTEFGGYAFRGQIGDDPLSTGLFVTQNGVMAGVVNIPGEGAFKIQYVGNGIHQIVELDPSKMARCGVDLLPDQFVAPAGNNNNNNNNGSDSVGPPAEPGGLPVASEPTPTPSLDGLPGLQDEAPTIVDILVVYTELSKAGAGGKDGIETLAQLAIEESNLCFSTSGINMQLNLVNVVQANYTETGNIESDLYNLSDGSIPDLETLRYADYKADLVSMITEREDSGTIAGIAWILYNLSDPGNRDSSAFSVVRRAYAVGNYVFPHEIGHNLGCAHDRNNADNTYRAFPYSYGQRFTAQGVTYATVMTYPPGVRIPYFSNPDISYNGTPTGVSSNSLFATDNAATIRYTSANVVSKYLTVARRYSFADVQFTGNEAGGSVLVTVKRVGSSISGMSIQYATADDSAKAGQDYVATNGTLAFAVGETEKSFSVNLINDSLHELPETFTVRLSIPRPLGNSALGTPETAMIVIEDDESSFFAQTSSMSVFENVGQASVMVVRSGQTNTTATLDYALVNITAFGGQDFVAASGQITFLPGEKLKPANITILNDFVPESDETFRLQLSNPSAGVVLVQPSSVVVKILDDDRPGGLVPYADNSGDLNDIVYSVKVRPNGKLLVGGVFSQVHGRRQAGIAQLNPDGTFDPTFDPGIGVDGSVLAVDLLADGRVVLGGDFKAVNGVTRYNIALLHENGSLDESFDPGVGPDDWVRGIAIDANQKIVIGGFFKNYAGTPKNYIARLGLNGALDNSFNSSPGPNSAVRSVAVDANGKIVIGGDFTQVSGNFGQYYGRLLANGNWDSSFGQLVGANSPVRAVAVQPDGKILLGGQFTVLDGQSARYVGRLNSTGSYDPTFSTANGPNDFVRGLVAVSSDNGVVIGGDFTAVGATSRSRIAKLTSTGSVDTVFNPGSGANALVWSVDTDAPGRVHVGGEFTQMNGEPRLRIATLRVTANQDTFEPVISPLSQSGLAGGQVRLNFSSNPGAKYALDYAHDLGGIWTPIVTNTASGSNMELIDAAPAPDHRYYRIRRAN